MDVPPAAAAAAPPHRPSSPPTASPPQPPPAIPPRPVNAKRQAKRTRSELRVKEEAKRSLGSAAQCNAHFKLTAAYRRVGARVRLPGLKRPGEGSRDRRGGGGGGRESRPRFFGHVRPIEWPEVKELPLSLSFSCRSARMRARVVTHWLGSPRSTSPVPSATGAPEPGENPSRPKHSRNDLLPMTPIRCMRELRSPPSQDSA
jgi:hypothetical protein